MTDEAPNAPAPMVQRPKRAYTRKETAGRPANPAAVAHEAGAEVLTRRSRMDGGNNDFDIPAHRKRQGWDYEWKTQTVMNQPIDGAHMARVYEGGWRPAPAKDFPELCPPGWAGKTVERLGQILMTRPMSLTMEARDEDYRIAERQKIEKLQGALAAPANQPKSMPRRVETFDIQGVAGVHEQGRSKLAG